MFIDIIIEKGEFMELAIPLDTMSIEEKIETMEIIWDDLCHRAKSIKSPPWHENILNKREENIKNDVEEFMDWETAKKNIKNKIQ